jgi:glycosyltransferase involved in cell wall biosynthesis
MHPRRPIRLLLREHGICGGVETVNFHLIRQFTKLVERVVVIIPEWRLKFYEQILPPSDRLIYQLPYSPRRAEPAYFLQKATSFALRQKFLPARRGFRKVREGLFNRWLKEVIREHNITHCFCSWNFCVDAPRVSVPMGVMLMDVRFKHFPETFPGFDIAAVDRQFRHWLRNSSVIFPVSETTAADIRRFYPWHAGITQVVPHGAEIGRRHQPRSRSGHVSEPGRFVFYYPAAANGHKNHITLFRACAELFAKGYDFDLVLTGFGTEVFGCTAPNGQASPKREAAIEFARLFIEQKQDLFHGRIKSLGYLERSRVEALYDCCTAVVLPSLFEGFGLPLVEALEHGASIICSDIPAHREQLARYDCVNQVTLVPPREITALAAAMEKLLTKTPPASSEKRAPNTLERWTWQDAAVAYLDSLGAVTPNHDLS